MFSIFSYKDKIDLSNYSNTGAVGEMFSSWKENDIDSDVNMRLIKSISNNHQVYRYLTPSVKEGRINIELLLENNLLKVNIFETVIGHFLSILFLLILIYIWLFHNVLSVPVLIVLLVQVLIKLVIFNSIKDRIIHNIQSILSKYE